MNNIVLAGNSGGAVAVLSSVFYQSQTLIDAVSPFAAGGVEIKNVLGPIDAPYYVGTPSVEYISRIKCILSLWGGVTVPVSATTPQQIAQFFSSNPLPPPPIIAFQGRNDNENPSTSVNLYFSPSTGSHIPYNSISICPPLNTTTFQTDIGNGADLNFIGSETIFEVLKLSTVKGACEIYIDCQMGHGLGDAGTSGGGSDGTDYFGLGPGNTKSSVYRYIAQRFSNFFQLVLSNPGYNNLPGKKKFFECKNNRKGCSLINDYDQANCCDDCTLTSETQPPCGVPN